MAHINGLVAMINSLQYSINHCKNSINDISARLKSLEEKSMNTTSIAAHVMPPVAQKNDEVHAIAQEIKNDQAMFKARFQAETDALRVKERALIEATISAKMEELVKRISRERVSSEVGDLLDNLKAYVDEQVAESREASRDYDNSDAASVAYSEATGAMKQRRGRGSKKTAITTSITATSSIPVPSTLSEDVMKAAGIEM